MEQDRQRLRRNVHERVEGTIRMTTDTELKALREQYLELHKSKLNEREAEKLKQQIAALDEEQKAIEQRPRGIAGAFTNLKGYLVETKMWLSFKLILIGVSFFYGGLYTNYQNYGSYLELGGIAMIGIGLWRIPYIKDFFKEAL
jgi:hypothetical protein